MTDAVYPVPEQWAEHALIDADRYEAMYRESVEDPDSFWRREAWRIDWISQERPPKVEDVLMLSGV